MEKSEFTFKFNGTKEIDVNLLIHSLQNISNSLQEISQCETGSPIDIKIKPFQEGSFEWIFGIQPTEITGAVSLFAPLVTGDDIIKKFKSVIEIVKFFKGGLFKEPKKLNDNKYEFINEFGENKIVHGDEIGNIFNNGGDITINYIENVIIDSENSKGIEGIQLLDRNRKELVTIDKTLISEVANKISKRIGEAVAVPKESKRLVNKDKVHIYITKPDLSGTSKWKAIFEENSIEVKVTDEEFLKKVHNREIGFVNGTCLEVDLQLNQIKDEKYKLWKNIPPHNVTRVHKIVPIENDKSFF